VFAFSHKFHAEIDWAKHHAYRWAQVSWQMKIVKCLEPCIASPVDTQSTSTGHKSGCLETTPATQQKNSSIVSEEPCLGDEVSSRNASAIMR